MTDAVTTPMGQVVRDAEGARLEFVRHHAAPVEAVWSALTGSARCARWFGSWTGDPASGTVLVTMTAEEGAQPEPVAVDACEPPRRLALTMPSPDGPWRLTVDLEEGGGRTTLRFAHRLAEPYDVSSIGPGWHFYLDRLGAVVDGAAVPADWDAYYPSLSGRYAAAGAARLRG